MAFVQEKIPAQVWEARADTKAEVFLTHHAPGVFTLPKTAQSPSQ